MYSNTNEYNIAAGSNWQVQSFLQTKSSSMIRIQASHTASFILFKGVRPITHLFHHHKVWVVLQKVGKVLSIVLSYLWHLLVGLY